MSQQLPPPPGGPDPSPPGWPEQGQPYAQPQPFGYPPAYGQPHPYGYQPYAYPYSPPSWGPQPANGLGTAGLVLGIVGIPFCMLFVPSILALIFGLVGRARVGRGVATNRGQATAGAILGAVGLVLGVVYLVLVLTLGHHGCHSDGYGDRNCTFDT